MSPHNNEEKLDLFPDSERLEDYAALALSAFILILVLVIY